MQQLRCHTSEVRQDRYRGSKAQHLLTITRFHNVILIKIM
jgi:hypothetical protein